MDAYRKTLKRRTLSMWLIALSAVILCTFFTFFTQREPRRDFVSGFQAGFQAGLVIAAILWTIRNKIILSDGERLRREYNRENDERLQLIHAKAGIPTMWLSSVIILVAGLVAGYFNFTAFVVLISVAAFQLLLSVVLRQVYSKIM